MQLTDINVKLCLALVVPALLMLVKLSSFVAGRLASYIVR